MTSFERWIADFGGQAELARTLGVHRSAVHHWLSGATNMQLIHALKILKLAKGRLTIEDLILAKRPKKGGRP